MKASTQYRINSRKKSNNDDNPNQNVCAQHVATVLGVASKVRYLHNINDVKRAARLQYSVRSVRSKVKSNTVGGARKMLDKIGAMAYIVHVDKHVLLLDKVGLTMVDTDPRVRDRRKLLGIWGVYQKG